MKKFIKQIFSIAFVLSITPCINLLGMQSSPEIDGYLADSAAKGRLGSCQTLLKLYKFSKEAIFNALCESIPDINSYYFQISDNKEQLLLDYVKIATLLMDAKAIKNNTTALLKQNPTSYAPIKLLGDRKEQFKNLVETVKKLIAQAKGLIAKKCIDTEINCEEVTDKDKKELHVYSLISSQYKNVLTRLRAKKRKVLDSKIDAWRLQEHLKYGLSPDSDKPYQRLQRKLREMSKQ